MEQITLGLDLEPRSEPPIPLQVEERKELVRLMAQVIVAVHRGQQQDGQREDAKQEQNDVADD